MTKNDLKVVGSLFLQTARLQRKRATLTIASIAWGTVSILLLLAFGNGLGIQFGLNQAAMGTNISIVWSGQTSKAYRGMPPGRRLSFHVEDPDYLRARMSEKLGVIIGEVEKGRVPLAYGHKTVNGQVIGTDAIYGLWRHEFARPGGRFFDVMDESNQRRVIFLGDTVSKDVFGSEKPVGKTLLVNNMPFLVIGVLKHKTQDSSYHTPDTNLVFIPRTTYRAMFGGNDVDNLVVGVWDASRMKEALQRVREILGSKYQFDASDDRALSVWNYVDDSKETRQIFLGIQLFLALVGGMTLLVGGIGVANIMYAVVKERTREIGIKMALGARPRWVTWPFILEASIYTLLGGTLGTLAAVVFCGLFSLIPTEGSDVMSYLGHPTLSIPIGVLTTLLLGGIGLAAGYFPARRAAAVDPAETLRYE
jgi:putative ABC transport system permease protein